MNPYAVLLFVLCLVIGGSSFLEARSQDRRIGFIIVTGIVALIFVFFAVKIQFGL